MVFYIATQDLPRVDGKSYKPGDLVPAESTGMHNIIAMGAVQELPGDPPAELVPEPEPDAKKEGRKERVNLNEVEGSGKSKRVTREDVEEEAKNPSKPDATGGAKELAEDLGIDLADVKNNGVDGRITKADVEAYADSKSSE